MIASAQAYVGRDDRRETAGVAMCAASRGTECDYLISVVRRWCCGFFMVRARVAMEWADWRGWESDQKVERARVGG